MLIRTVRESYIDELVRNTAAQAAIEVAAQATTLDDPFIRLRERHLTVDLTNAVVNFISSTTGHHFLAMSSGLPVIERAYIFALTFEKVGEKASPVIPRPQSKCPTAVATSKMPD
jgi:hypothetical protein